MMNRKGGSQSATLVLAFLVLLFGSIQSSASGPTGSSWMLEKGRDIAPSRARKLKLRVQGVNLSGYAGCNNFTAGVQDGSSNRVVIKQISLTRKLCDDKRNDVEAAFLRALDKTAFLEKHRNTLTFLSEQREALLVWQRAGISTARAARRKAAVRSQRRNQSRSVQCWT